MPNRYHDIHNGIMCELIIFHNALYIHICHSTILHFDYIDFGIAQSITFYNIAIVNWFLAQAKYNN